MDIFISWSGLKSGACATAIREWLPCVMQSVKPWCSSEDISKGARGGLEIAQKLGSVNFGIVCLTPSNMHNEWIHFESGALSKSLDGSALFTLLLGLQPADIKPPLGHFQHTRATKTELMKLVQTINDKSSAPLAHAVLSASFEAFWPKLESTINSLPEDSVPPPTTRPDREVLEEILSLVRGQGQKHAISEDEEGRKRRMTTTLTFADGYLRERGYKPSLSGHIRDDEFILKIIIMGTEYEVKSPFDIPLSEAMSQVVSELKVIADNEIPF